MVMSDTSGTPVLVLGETNSSRPLQTNRSALISAPNAKVPEPAYILGMPEFWGRMGYVQLFLSQEFNNIYPSG